MKVKSAPGTRCPKEGKPKAYITDAVPVEVPDTAYYRRMVAEGSLVTAAEEPAAEDTKTKKGGKE